MKKPGSVYVLAFTLIFIGSICTELNPELPQTLVKQRSKYSEKSRHSSYQQRRDLRFENEYNEDGGVGFCNYSYDSIEATMRVDGNDFVFVNDGEVIDGRNGQKMAVQSLFPEGPTCVQAAVYSQENIEAYLFNYKDVWVYMFHSDEDKFIHRGIFHNFIKHSHSPECAMMYYDEIHLLKESTFFRFEPYIKNPDQQGIERLGGLWINVKVDAAISSDHDIKFIVKDKVFQLVNKVGVEVISANKTNLVFNKCKK